MKKLTETANPTQPDALAHQSCTLFFGKITLLEEALLQYENKKR